MNLEEVTTTLQEMFGEQMTMPTPASWQVETESFRLLVLLSEDQSWLRILIPVAPAPEAIPFLEELMQANFDETQECRYALHQNVLWGVFLHRRESLLPADFLSTVKQLISIQKKGLSDSFNQLVESRIRQIILASKLQGQSLESTLQTLDRFYEEGLMGNMEQGAESRDTVLAAWRYQLERLWNEVESSE